ncbi:MAG: transglutaminase family protein [Actinomycetota bacterium]|nr:transglutaminase family protein [Actinomycetota bacterium]
MKWRLEIVHTTKYTYQEDVYSSYNEVRMTPKNTSNQLLLSSSIAVSPRASLYNYFDYFGTAVTYFDLHRRHNNLDITSSSHVEIEDPRTRGVRLSPIEMSDPSFMDAFSEYLTTTTYTQVSNGVASQIQSSVSSVETAEDRLSKVVEFVRENLHYRSGITMVSSSASEALDIGFGVCQDFAHVTIALLRSIGLPARYVSGYLYPNKDPEVGESSTGESHAWVEVFVGEWIGIDPSNCVDRTNHLYVTVAKGRDYGDVTPFRGVYFGGQSSPPIVTVTMTRRA